MVPLILAAMAMQAWSGTQQAEAIRESRATQDKINALNQKYAAIDAYEAEKYGYTMTARYQETIDKTIGEQRSELASRNVDVSYGTSAEIQNESKLTGFLNTIDIQNQARARAYGIRVQASNANIQNSMHDNQSEMDASAAQRNGFIGAAVTGMSLYKRSGGYHKTIDDTGDNSTGDLAGEGYQDTSNIS